MRPKARPIRTRRSGRLRTRPPTSSTRGGWPKRPRGSPPLDCGAYDRVVAYDEKLADRIRQLLSAERGLTEQRMFGGLAFLIGGNMAVGVSGQGGLLIRCDPGETDSLLEEPGAMPFE